VARRTGLIWTAPALDDLDHIASWIALENERAASELVRRVLDAVERLARFPASGRRVPEAPSTPYREVIVPPCRVIYRRGGRRILIVHVVRSERLLRPRRLR
jgi:toxin ParE1/3/4